MMTNINQLILIKIPSLFPSQICHSFYKDLTNKTTKATMINMSKTSKQQYRNIFTRIFLSIF